MSGVDSINAVERDQERANQAAREFLIRQMLEAEKNRAACERLGLSTSEYEREIEVARRKLGHE